MIREKSAGISVSVVVFIEALLDLSSMSSSCILNYIGAQKLV